ncbi:MAG: glycosyl transferase [Planctomycetaceae bacterium]|nr:MAG: glycosyl transferase [Planctomycetaceae bacterium]
MNSAIPKRVWNREDGTQLTISSRDPLLSVVLPVFNERAVLPRLVSRLHEVLEHQINDYELIFVNDGSTDGTGEWLDQQTEADPHLVVLHFSRNFGHQAAVQAGLDAARGEAIVVMDSDLQDDPAAIPRFLQKWREGYDVVYAIRTKRKEAWWKRLLFKSFYRLLVLVSNTPIPVDAGNFGLIDRRVARELCQLPERSRFYPGLRHWVGFRQIGIPVERHSRHDDHPRVSLWGLIRLAKTAIFSFSTAPLALFYGVAILSLLVCIGLTIFTLQAKIRGIATPGWTSGLITASFFGTLNALGIAVLGEYVVRIFDQVRARPSYIVERTVSHNGLAPGCFPAHRPGRDVREGMTTAASITKDSAIESLHGGG